MIRHNVDNYQRHGRESFYLSLILKANGVQVGLA
jgi:hypothetical protein